jgi:hypothetical protein
LNFARIAISRVAKNRLTCVQQLELRCQNLKNKQGTSTPPEGCPEPEEHTRLIQALARAKADVEALSHIVMSNMDRISRSTSEEFRGLVQGKTIEKEGMLIKF